jgi:hypothetical protein
VVVSGAVARLRTFEFPNPALVPACRDYFRFSSGFCGSACGSWWGCRSVLAAPPTGSPLPFHGGSALLRNGLRPLIREPLRAFRAGERADRRLPGYGAANTDARIARRRRRTETPGQPGRRPRRAPTETRGVPYFQARVDGLNLVLWQGLRWSDVRPRASQRSDLRPHFPAVSPVSSTPTGAPRNWRGKGSAQKCANGMPFTTQSQPSAQPTDYQIAGAKAYNRRLAVFGAKGRPRPSSQLRLRQPSRHRRSSR